MSVSEEIAIGLATGRSFADIAVQLGRPTSTVSREVDRNDGRGCYRASKAQRRADDKARRPRLTLASGESRRVPPRPFTALLRR